MYELVAMTQSFWSHEMSSRHAHAARTRYYSSSFREVDQLAFVEVRAIPLTGCASVVQQYLVVSIDASAAAISFFMVFMFMHLVLILRFRTLERLVP